MQDLDNSGDSDWSLEDEPLTFPIISLSSTSPSERSEDISLTDSDDSSIRHRRPKYEKNNGYFMYKEEVVDKLIYEHFMDDDDDISVSSIEQDDFMTRHRWDFSKKFKITFNIPYLPAIKNISDDFMKFFNLSMWLQGHHLIFGFIWIFLTCKFFTLDEDEATMSFIHFAEHMKPVMAFEIVLNFILPLLGFIRHVNQRIRTLVIFHDLTVFTNVCHLILLVCCGAGNVVVFSNLEAFAEDEMSVDFFSPIWENTQTIRQCCGAESKVDWKFDNVVDDFELSASCCNPVGLIGNCSSQNKNVWTKGCFSSSSDEMRAVRIFAWLTFILLTLSLYHNISAYLVLERVRSMLKSMNPQIVYGTPKWVVVRHSTFQYNYGMVLAEVDKQIRWEKEVESGLEDSVSEEDNYPAQHVSQAQSMQSMLARQPLESYMEF